MIALFPSDATGLISTGCSRHKDGTNQWRREGESDKLQDVGEVSLQEDVMATYKPGEKAPDSGELVEIGPRGGQVDGGRVVVIERGERVPPTSESGNEFRYKRGSKTTH